jgi:hypothetical protein
MAQWQREISCMQTFLYIYRRVWQFFEVLWEGSRNWRANTTSKLADMIFHPCILCRVRNCRHLADMFPFRNKSLTLAQNRSSQDNAKTFYLWSHGLQGMRESYLNYIHTEIKSMKDVIFWYIKPYKSVEIHWRFERTYCLHFHGRQISQASRKGGTGFACRLLVAGYLLG